jgi:N-acetyl-anhydromuramyl-L-alanine amidase AmpD
MGPEEEKIPPIFLLTPNEIEWNPKNKLLKPKGILIHAIGQYLDGMRSHEFIHKLGLSAHRFVQPDGIVQSGQDINKVAYHAGKSKWLEYENLNNYFLSIEVEVEGKWEYAEFIALMKSEKNWMSDRAYEVTAYQCALWMEEFPSITTDYITTHALASPGRKWDPGNGIDLKKFRKDTLTYKNS